MPKRNFFEPVEGQAPEKKDDKIYTIIAVVILILFIAVYSLFVKPKHHDKQAAKHAAGEVKPDLPPIQPLSKMDYGSEKIKNDINAAKQRVQDDIDKIKAQEDKLKLEALDEKFKKY